MNKRGQAEQFNWIFVIVAGAIILGFFVMFIFKFVELQEKKQDIDTVRFFSTGILRASSRLQVGSGGAAVDSQGEDGIRFGYNTRLGYLCRGDEASVLIGESGSAYYNLEDEVVFMDRQIYFGALDGLDLWVLPWRYPFHITNFIYLANSNRKFYLVYDNTGRERVNELDISNIFDVEILPESEAGSFDRNSKVVYFTAGESNIRNGESIDFVHINGNKARFFEGNSWSDEVEFYGTEQLYGAIFSNDAENFQCNVNRAMEGVKTIATIYTERARILGQIDRREGCNYAGIFNTLSHYSAGRFDVENALKEENIGASGGCLWVF